MSRDEKRGWTLDDASTTLDVVRQRFDCRSTTLANASTTLDDAQRRSPTPRLSFADASTVVRRRSPTLDELDAA